MQQICKGMCDILFIGNKHVPSLSEGILSSSNDGLFWSDISVKAELGSKLTVCTNGIYYDLDVPCRNQTKINGTDTLFDGLLKVRLSECDSATSSKLEAEEFHSTSITANVINATSATFDEFYIDELDMRDIQSDLIKEEQPAHVYGSLEKGILRINKKEVVLPTFNQSCIDDTTMFQGTLKTESLHAHELHSDMLKSNSFSCKKLKTTKIQTKSAHCKNIQCDSLNCASITINNECIPPYEGGVLYYDGTYQWKVPSINVNGCHLHINKNIVIDTKLPFHCCNTTCTDLNAYTLNCAYITSDNVNVQELTCGSLNTLNLKAQNVKCRYIQGTFKSSSILSVNALIGGVKLPSLPEPEKNSGVNAKHNCAQKSVLHFDERLNKMQWQPELKHERLPIPPMYRRGNRTTLIEAIGNFDFSVDCAVQDSNNDEGEQNKEKNNENEQNKALSLIDGCLVQGYDYDSISVSFKTPYCVNIFILHLRDVAASITTAQTIQFQGMCDSSKWSFLSHTVHPLSLGYLDENRLILHCTCNIANYTSYKVVFEPSMHILQAEFEYKL